MYPQQGGGDAGARTAGYDRVSTMFSPKGRLYQVEYAARIVEQGTLGVGIVYNNGVLLGAEKNVPSKLLLPNSIEKIFKVDDHIGVISSGLVGDARRLVKLARQEAQENRMMFDEKIQVEALVKDISSTKQVFTQYAGMRPFGVSLIIGGIDDSGARLFETEPSGALAEYKAVAIGRGRRRAMEVLEEKYREKMSLQNSVQLIVEVISEAVKKEEKLDLNKLDFAYIDAAGEFTQLSLKEVKSFLGQEKAAK